MIRSLCGTVLNVAENSVLLEVNGLGFDLLCTRAAAGLCRAGETARLTTYLQISEAGVALYGFASERERLCSRLEILRRGSLKEEMV